MRLLSIILFSVILGLAGPPPAIAGVLDFLDGLALGTGWNQATNNDANESMAFSVKHRGNRWEYGLDYCQSDARGGEGSTDFVFVWGACIEEFDRPVWQDYGIFVGAGAGVILLEDELIDWPAGPFLVLGWDFSDQAGLEGKLGYYGENYWGTALFYWYFD